MYEYQARIMAVHDGDTLTVEVDLGFDIHFTQSCRLHGLNAPELRTPEGKASREFVISWLKKNAPSPLGGFPIPSGPLTLTTFKDRREKYGRYLAEIESLGAAQAVDGPNLNHDLLASGNAVVYMPDR